MDTRAWASDTEGVPMGIPNLLDTPEPDGEEREATPERPLADMPAAVSARWADERVSLQIQLDSARKRGWIMSIAGLLVGAAVTAAWFA